MSAGSDSLGGSAHGFAAHSRVSASVQLAPEEPADSPGRAVNGSEQIRVGFLDCHSAERQQFGANAAPVLSRPIRTDSDNGLPHPTAKPSQSEMQAPFDVRFECLSQV